MVSTWSSLCLDLDHEAELFMSFISSCRSFLVPSISTPTALLQSSIQLPAEAVCPIIDREQDILHPIFGFLQFGPNEVYYGLHLFLVAFYCCLHLFLSAVHLLLLRLNLFLNLIHLLLLRLVVSCFVFILGFISSRLVFTSAFNSCRLVLI
jgi:hypothetical protein